MKQNTEGEKPGTGRRGRSGRKRQSVSKGYSESNRV